MAGYGKRPAYYVPSAFRAQLEKLSKADLMEIAWDYAVRTAGEDAGDDNAFLELRETARIVATSQGRKAAI